MYVFIIICLPVFVYRKKKMSFWQIFMSVLFSQIEMAKLKVHIAD